MTSRASDPLFTRTGVTRRDERFFGLKLAVLVLLLGLGTALALRDEVIAIVAGIVLLAGMFVHATELAHQCLHHSAFRRSRAHRPVGVVLALPLLVVYSHYRLRHLQHHRFLGTAQDTEFFGFGARTPLTVGALLRGLFDYRRLGVVVRDVVRAARGRWRYDFGEVSPAVRRHIVADHLVLGAVLLVAVGVCAAGFGEVVARLWLLPLVLAVPVHFLVELPEHVLCDSDSTDVLANTRSITGSRLSTWFTNGNNLHVEHHAAMVVPMNRLRTRHDETRRRARYVEDSYPAFYRTLGWALVRGESKRVRADAGCGCATPPTESRREHRCP